MTTDRSGTHVALDDRLERDLLALLAVQPSPAVLDRLDRRVQARLRAWQPSLRGQRPRSARRLGVVGLMAAALVLAGANGSLHSLYLLIWGPFDVPWHRGVALDLSEVVDGYRVTIDRAYADATRVALALSVVDERRREGTTQLSAMGVVVSDDSGTYAGSAAASTPDGRHAAANVVWTEPAALPLPAGPRRFEVVVPSIGVRDDSVPPPDADDIGWNPWHTYPGPWTFEFELVVDGGTTVTPDAVADVNGVRVTLPRLIAASGIVRVELEIDDGMAREETWAPIGEIRHGEQVLAFVASRDERSGSVVVMTDGGVPDASGEWTVTITELVGSVDRLQGPWVLRFEAP